MLNDIGKELRHLRINRNERLYDMAQRLEVSSAFLSALEHGKKAVPPSFEEKLIAVYQLGPHEADALCRAADQSRKSFTIEATTPAARDLAGLLARRMPTLSDEDMQKMLAILKKGT